LCALLVATRMEGIALPGPPRREVRRRLTAFTKASWPAGAVRKAIGDVQAVVTESVGVAAIAVMTSS
jgi:hypothetical protein